jgi:hypothetical protein
MSRLAGLLLLVMTQSAVADVSADAVRCRDADAAYNSAIIYLNRVPRKPDRAIALLTGAAIAGHAKAQEALAMQFDYGRTVPRNQIGAYIWYSIAARVIAGPTSSWSGACLGPADFSGTANIGWRVTHRRDELASVLSAGDLSAANRAAQNWKSGAGDPTQLTLFGSIPPSQPELPPNHPSQGVGDGSHPVQSPERRLSAETIPIQKRGNAYTVPVRINQTITLPFILDTGAGELAIPADVALTLIRAGALTGGDFVGKGRYSMANGAEQLSDRVILREVQVGEHTVRNVTAFVSPPAGEPLLGQSFLSKFGTVTLDYKRLVLVLSR